MPVEVVRVLVLNIFWPSLSVLNVLLQLGGPQTAAQWDQWSAQTHEAFQPPPSYVQSSLCVRVCVCGEGCVEGGVSVCVWLWVWGQSLCMYMCVYMSGCIVRVGMNSLTAFIGGSYSQMYMCVCKCVCVCAWGGVL